MTERLLQFIWQFQYFNLNDVRLVSGESLQVIYPGNFNTNQGPDFLEARIKIDDTTWVGNVELHLNEDDWLKHAHHCDPNFQNVILVGGNFKHTHQSFTYFNKAEEAAAYIKQQNFQHAYFLIKGSRSMQMEKVLSAFAIE